MIRPLRVGNLRKRINPKVLAKPFELTMPIDFVGQNRAQRALNLALSPEESRFHVLLVTNDLPLEIVKEYVESKIKERIAKGEKFHLSDYCYVHNFTDDTTPSLLVFPAGVGATFKLGVQGLREQLKNQAVAMDSALEQLRQSWQREFTAQAAEDVTEIYEELLTDGTIERWRAHNVAIKFNQDKIHCSFEFYRGIEMNYVQETEFITDADRIQAFLNQLSDEERTICESYLRETEELGELFQNIYDKRNSEFNEYAKGESRKMYLDLVKELFANVAKLYAKNAKAVAFLKSLEHYTVSILNLFIPQYSQEFNTFGLLQKVQVPFENVLEKMRRERNEDPLIPFEVNLFVDNAKTNPPPVIAECAPTYAGLFGKTERAILLMERGYSHTDHTKLQSGAMHRANGGFLILNLTDIASLKEYIFLGLKRTLAEKKIKIQDPGEEMGLSADVKSLRAEPMDMELKIIAVIRPDLYYAFHNNRFSREFIQHFTMLAMFDTTIELLPENLAAYAAWMQKYTQRKSFLPISRGAIVEIIEWLLRRAESQNRFVCDIEEIKTLIKEAYFYAKTDDSVYIEGLHIIKALAEWQYRSNLFEEQMQTKIIDGHVKIETQGEKIGQINGLAVWRTDEYLFGLPTRVTVTTYRGKGSLINIQKQAGLAGPTLTLGIEILQGFFFERYGQDKQIGFEGRVVFEENYGMIDGPSATTAQLFALLSAITKKPIKQGLAITGTVDQKGNIGAIGGVNEKIEGFFKVCEARGLNGCQGVIIPRANTKELMLNHRVVEAVSSGKFNVYAIDKIDEGVEILMGCRMEEIDQLVQKRLEEWASHDNPPQKTAT